MPQPCYTKEEEDWAKSRRLIYQRRWYMLNKRIMVPQAQQWKLIKTLHEATHYGGETLWYLLQFMGKGIKMVVDQINKS